ncbi:MAG: hypothetical protein RBU37_26620, partial [Myxococcota bacterium]|nr:hypothetical protein [Myxococcota bacterium]
MLRTHSSIPFAHLHHPTLGRSAALLLLLLLGCRGPSIPDAEPAKQPGDAKATEPGPPALHADASLAEETEPCQGLEDCLRRARALDLGVD